MKAAYKFSTQGHSVFCKLGKMILPQLEQNIHGVDVVGMFFTEDNVYVLQKGNLIGEGLTTSAAGKDMLLMACEQCAYEREIDDMLGEGAAIGGFPDLFGALSGKMLWHVITL